MLTYSFSWRSLVTYAEACLGTVSSAGAPARLVEADAATVKRVADCVATLGQVKRRRTRVTEAAGKHMFLHASPCARTAALCFIWAFRRNPKTCGPALLRHVRAPGHSLALTAANTALLHALSLALDTVSRCALARDAAAAAYAALGGACASLTALGATEARLRAPKAPYREYDGYSHSHRDAYELPAYRCTVLRLLQALQPVVQAKWVTLRASDVPSLQLLRLYAARHDMATAWLPL